MWVYVYHSLLVLLSNGHYYVNLGQVRYMINKISESEIWVQPDSQKIKTARCWLLPLYQYEIAILPSGDSE